MNVQQRARLSCDLTALVFLMLASPVSVLLADPNVPDAPHPPTPATEQSDWTEARANAEVGRMVEGLPSLGQRSIDQVIQFSIDDRYLSVRTPLTDVEEIKKVEIPGFVGVSTINVLPLGGENGSKFPQFKHWQVTPGMLILTDVLSSANGMVQIVQATEGPLGMRQVELLQSPVVEEDRALRLRVKTTSDLLPNASAGDLDLSARDWTEFRTLYPRAVSIYLRPVFRQLGAEQSLLQISTAEAWQVLAREWTEPAGLRDQVDPVLARLDADNFRDRARAAKELDTLGLPGAMLLTRTDRQTLTPEQATRVDEFLQRTLALSPDLAKALSEEADYLTTLLYIEDADLTAAALKRMHELNAQAPSIRLDLTGKARMDAVDALWNTSPTTQSVR